eukprot:scaffold3068_cov401-Prasinococcus_capsulatus_cf.AAC.44
MHMCGSVDVYGFAQDVDNGYRPINPFNREPEMAYYFPKHEGLVPDQSWGRPEVILKVRPSHRLCWNACYE